MTNCARTSLISIWKFSDVCRCWWWKRWIDLISGQLGEGGVHLVGQGLVPVLVDTKFVWNSSTPWELIPEWHNVTGRQDNIMLAAPHWACFTLRSLRSLRLQRSTAVAAVRSLIRRGLLLSTLGLKFSKQAGEKLRSVRSEALDEQSEAENVKLWKLWHWRLLWGLVSH